MSLEKKIKVAAGLAAGEAAQVERGRILWILDESEKELRAGFKEALLVESERHAAQVKLQIAVALHKQLRIRIASGVRKCNSCDGPVINRTTCERCMLTKRSPNGDG